MYMFVPVLWPSGSMSFEAPRFKQSGGSGLNIVKKPTFAVSGSEYRLIELLIVQRNWEELALFAMLLFF